MSLAGFLNALFDSGRVRVAALGPLPAEELRAAELALVQHEGDFRRDFPGDAPLFDLQSAVWSAVLVYRAAQFAVFRDIDASLVSAALSVACPVPLSPSAHYSVDLTFRFLPDLAKLAKSASRLP